MLDPTCLGFHHHGCVLPTFKQETLLPHESVFAPLARSWLTPAPAQGQAPRTPHSVTGVSKNLNTNTNPISSLRTWHDTKSAATTPRRGFEQPPSYEEAVGTFRKDVALLQSLDSTRTPNMIDGPSLTQVPDPSGDVDERAGEVFIPELGSLQSTPEGFSLRILEKASQYNDGVRWGTRPTNERAYGRSRSPASFLETSRCEERCRQGSRARLIKDRTGLVSNGLIMRYSLFFFLSFFFLLHCAMAQDSRELSDTPPVAIIGLSQGVADIKHPDGDWGPAYWLTLVRPEDQIRTEADGKLVLTFFHDNHREVVEPDVVGKVGFRSASKTEGTGEIKQDRPKDRGVSEIPIPYLLIRKLTAKEFESADEEGALEREQTFLSSYVKAQAFPPVFVWRDTGAQNYKLQLFNEWDEFLYEKETPETRFKYPHRGDFQLAKNSLYKWQVTDENDQIVVRRYPFVLLTLLHSRELARAEKRFAKLEKDGKTTQADQTDLFLLYVQRRMIDKYLHALERMAKEDHQNPVIHRGLVRAYLAKGAPAHAWQSLETERSYGGVDEVRD
jgi:hypothetical protein